jgi:hypothetical protein
MRSHFAFPYYSGWCIAAGLVYQPQASSRTLVPEQSRQSRKSLEVIRLIGAVVAYPSTWQAHAEAAPIDPPIVL